MKYSLVIGRETLSPGLVGLSVTYAMSVTQALNFLIRMTSEVETNIVAAERLKEYVDNPQEAEFNIARTKPDKDWPQSGKIVFKKYSMKYRYCDIKGWKTHFQGKRVWLTMHVLKTYCFKEVKNYISLFIYSFNIQT